MDLSKIDIIVSEVDGVITNDCIALDGLNNTLFKSYCGRDFEAINELKKVFTFVFISSDPNITYGVMQRRNIPFFCPKTRDDKLKILTGNILSRYNMKPENLLYIGSKLSDVACMNLAEVSLHPSDAPKKLYNLLNSNIIHCSGGNGVITTVYDAFTSEIDRRVRLM